jgi:hypothetical protein
MYNGYDYPRRRLRARQDVRYPPPKPPAYFSPYVRLERPPRSDPEYTAPVTQDVLYVDENSDDFTPYGRKSSGSSVFDDESIHEHGRTYQGYRAGKYFLPNDGEEQDRLDLQHNALFILLDKRLYLAPINQPANVLDIGTGT